MDPLRCQTSCLARAPGLRPDPSGARGGQDFKISFKDTKGQQRAQRRATRLAKERGDAVRGGCGRRAEELGELIAGSLGSASCAGPAGEQGEVAQLRQGSSD